MPTTPSLVPEQELTKGPACAVVLAGIWLMTPLAVTTLSATNVTARQVSVSVVTDVLA